MEGIEVSKLRKPRDVWKIRFNKYFQRIVFGFGIGFIIISIICRVVGWDGIWLISVSLMENIGAACLIPPLFVWLKEVISWGLRPERPPMDVYLSQMKSDLRMQGISLYDIHKNPEDFNAYLKKILERKRPLRFTFLVMDPGSDFLKLRAKEEGKPLKEFLKEIEKTLEELKIIKSIAERGVEKVEFKIYVYNASPTHSLIWVDNMMYVGPYFRKQPGYETFWIDISSGEEAYKELENDFNQLLGETGTKELKTKGDLENMIKIVRELITKEEEEESSKEMRDSEASQKSLSV